MTRNLKALGLALVAAMALGAIGAQGASAHEFRSGAADTVLTGSIESGEHLFVGKAGVEPVKCSAATFEGRNAGTERDTVTVHPKYSSCSFLGEPASVHTGGCNYIFDSDTTTSTHSSTGEHATVDIECEASHYIEVTTEFCDIRFNAQTSLHGVRYTEVPNHSGKEAVTVNATVKTIAFETTAGSFCGLAGLPAGKYTSGEYTGNASVTGFKFSSEVSGSTTNGRTWSHGEQVSITVN